MADIDVDILIVGGGLIGASLTLALLDAGFRTLLVEAHPFSEHIQPDFDARSLALSPASVRILQMLKVWPRLCESACAIDTIQVSEQHCFGRARLCGDANNPLGYVVEMQHISAALHALLPPECILAPASLTALNPEEGMATLSRPTGDLTVQAKLIVAADGVHSTVRALCGVETNTKHYEQKAVVANIGLARPHQQQAFERFTTTGPLALLPLNGLRAALVWSLPSEEADRYACLPERDFLTALQRHFGYQLGRFTRAGQRMVYPLQQVLASQQVMDRVVFIGNAAHTLHPVAGQGFNLGLRDVAMLAQCIVQHGLNPAMLKTYQASRQHDQTSITRLTDGLIELFTSKIPGMAIARSAGLMALDNIPLLKRVLTRYARGFAGTIPDLVCGIALHEEGRIHETSR